MARRAELDRALPVGSPGMWFLTVAIVVIGVLVVLLLSLGGGVRHRISAVEEIPIGVDTSRVLDALGAPGLRCGQGSLAHLAPSFPPGWPSAAVDVELAGLEAATVSRWLYPIADGEGTCEAGPRRTEIGVGERGEVVWTVAIAGESLLHLPPDLESSLPDPSTEP